MKIKSIIFMLFLLLSAASCFAAGPSFDCAKAATSVEKMICADAELSRLDVELARVYDTALKKSTDQAALKQQQRDWLTVRNSCEDADCIEMSYRSQIGELQGEPAAGHFLTILSKNPAMCAAYKDYVEHEVATHDQEVHNASPMCQRFFGKGYPEFTSVQWREISPIDHPELAVQAYRYMNHWQAAGYSTTESSFKDNLDGIVSKHSRNWWHMWLGEADIGNNGQKETLLRVESGRCGSLSSTYRPPRWQIPVMVVDATGKGIDTEKSEQLLKVTVAYPVSTLFWPLALYCSPNIKPIPGLHSTWQTSFGVFVFSETVFFDQWIDEWSFPLKGIVDPRYTNLAVFQISEGQTETICRFKFRKPTN
jgi:uncharacterized protein